MARQAGYSDIIITGDMNSDFNTRDGHILLNFVNSNNMSALINEPTRITPTSATVLDQFLVSDHLTITDISVGAPLETSDHCEITCQLKFSKNTNNAFSKSVWDYKKSRLGRSEHISIKHNWDDCFTAADVSSCVQLWTETFLSYARRFIHSNLITIRPWDKSWYNNELRLKKRKRDRTFKIAKRSNTTSDWTKYRQCRNEYVYALEAAENEFKQKQINKIYSGTVNHRS